MNVRRLTFAALTRLRSVPRSAWVGTVIGMGIGWVLVATLSKAPMAAPVAVGFAWCMFVGFALSGLMGVLLVRSDRTEERLTHLEIRAERLPELPATVLPEDETPEPEGGDWYAKLRAGAEAVNARMQPTFLEPEPPNSNATIRNADSVRITEPAPKPRPSPVPREPAPLITEPMEIADELAADAHAYVVLTEQQQWEAEQEAKWAAIEADIEEMAKGVGSGSDR